MQEKRSDKKNYMHIEINIKRNTLTLNMQKWMEWKHFTLHSFIYKILYEIAFYHFFFFKYIFAPPFSYNFLMFKLFHINIIIFVFLKGFGFKNKALINNLIWIFMVFFVGLNWARKIDREKNLIKSYDFKEYEWK